MTGHHADTRDRLSDLRAAIRGLDTDQLLDRSALERVVAATCGALRHEEDVARSSRLRWSMRHGSKNNKRDEARFPMYSEDSDNPPWLPGHGDTALENTPMPDHKGTSR
jgi:hypothetical protein